MSQLEAIFWRNPIYYPATQVFLLQSKYDNFQQPSKEKAEKEMKRNKFEPAPSHLFAVGPSLVDIAKFRRGFVMTNVMFTTKTPSCLFERSSFNHMISHNKSH